MYAHSEDQILEIHLSRDNIKGHFILENITDSENGYTGDLGKTDVTTDSESNQLASYFLTLEAIEEGSDIRLVLFENV